MDANYYINRKQAVSYGIIAYHTLINSAYGKEFSYNQLAEEIVCVMKLYSPNVAVKKAQKLLQNNEIKFKE